MTARGTHSPSRRALRAARAFSLIEVVLTLSILLIGIVALSQTLPVAFGTMTHDRLVNTADRIAMTVIEQNLQAHFKKTLVAGTAGPTAYNAQAAAESGAPFDVTVTVTDNAVVTRGRRIDVLVAWTEAGLNRSRRLTTHAFITW